MLLQEFGTDCFAFAIFEAPGLAKALWLIISLNQGLSEQL